MSAKCGSMAREAHAGGSRAVAGLRRAGARGCCCLPSVCACSYGSPGARGAGFVLGRRGRRGWRGQGTAEAAAGQLHRLGEDLVRSLGLFYKIVQTRFKYKTA